MRMHWITAALSFIALWFTGCGGVGTLTGTVEYQGKQMKTGTVTVMGSDNIAYPGALDENGKFKIGNIPTGQVKIAVDSPDPNPMVNADPNLTKKPVRPDDPQPGRASVPKGVWFPIPEKYGDAGKSGVTVEIKSGENELNIKLQ